MKAVSGFTIETVAYRFELTIFRKPGRNTGFVGRFVGVSNQEVRPVGKVKRGTRISVEGTLEGFYEARLIAQCRAEIDRIDGPILRALPRKVLTRRGARAIGPA